MVSKILIRLIIIAIFLLACGKEGFETSVIILLVLILCELIEMTKNNKQ
jgi:hypothetical protein